eukprot:gene45497-66449_t
MSGDSPHHVELAEDTGGGEYVASTDDAPPQPERSWHTALAPAQPEGGAAPVFDAARGSVAVAVQRAPFLGAVLVVVKMNSIPAAARDPSDVGGQKFGAMALVIFAASAANWFSYRDDDDQLVWAPEEQAPPAAPGGGSVRDTLQQLRPRDAAGVVISAVLFKGRQLAFIISVLSAADYQPFGPRCDWAMCRAGVWTVWIGLWLLIAHHMVTQPPRPLLSSPPARSQLVSVKGRALLLLVLCSVIGAACVWASEGRVAYVVADGGENTTVAAAHQGHVHAQEAYDVAMLLLVSVLMLVCHLTSCCSCRC